MDKADFKNLIKKAGKTQLDIASDLKMGPATIRRYLNNEAVSRRTQADIERYLDELRAKLSSPDGGPKAA